MKKVILILTFLLMALCGCDKSHNERNEKKDIGKQNLNQMLKTSNQTVTGKLNAHPIDSAF